MLTGGLVGELGEAPDQLLVEVAHLQVGDRVGVKVDVGEPRDDQVEQVGPLQPGDLDVEVELLEDVPGRRREPGDVAAQVAGDMGGVLEQPVEVERGDVVEGLAGNGAEHRLDVLDALALELLGPGRARLPWWAPGRSRGGAGR